MTIGEKYFTMKLETVTGISQVFDPFSIQANTANTFLEKCA